MSSVYEKVKVSVVVTTKNEEKNIKVFLESIKSQTYNAPLRNGLSFHKNLEIIVVDNNSEDETKEIARRFTKKVYNFGPERSAQRNYGVRKAKGDFILILDADMELSPKVVEDCVKTAMENNLKVLIIPEKTVGDGIIPKIRQFEREMYMGDLTVEVARFFDRKVFSRFGGYDLNLTGPEDYDLPYRIRKKYKIGRTREYIYHHETGLNLSRLLKKKFYYASQGAQYAKKHPELVRTQGNLLFRKAYFRNWRNFIKHPLVGISFLIVRLLETIWAVAGFIKAVGFYEFFKTFIRMLKSKKDESVIIS